MKENKMKMKRMLLPFLLLAAIGIAMVATRTPLQAQNVSVHARIVCRPSAGLYDNPNGCGRQIDSLPFHRKVGFRGYVNENWARIEVFNAPSEVRWGFVRRQCVGAFNSW